MAHAIRTVGVIGTGVIGSSWTGLFLAKGLKVLVSDPAPDAEPKLRAYINEIWPTLKQLSPAKHASPDNYVFVGASMKNHYHELDFVQENAPERPDLKNSLIAEIDAATAEHVVIASSSSGIPSSQFIGQCTRRPGRVLIGHPFNPPHLMPLVEVVPHPKTDADAVTQALDFYRALGKQPIHVRQETPGFVANRLQAALCNEAYSLVDRGIVSAEDLDACMTTSLGPRWALTGPFMSNVMGGGGGSQGFNHLVTHLGPAVRAWTEDMQKHAFQWDETGIGRMNDSVEKMLEHQDAAKVEEQRDQVLVSLLNLKADASALV